MNTNHFRSQLLAAQAKKSGETFLQSIRPKLFSSNANDEEQQQEEDTLSILEEIVTQFRQQLKNVQQLSNSYSDHVISNGNNSNGNNYYFVDAFLRQFSASSVVASLQQHKNFGTTNSNNNNSNNNNSIPLSTMLLQNVVTSTHNKKLFIDHANLLLDHFETSNNNTNSNHNNNNNSIILFDFASFMRTCSLSTDPAIRALWAKVIESRIQKKVEESCDPFEQSQYGMLVNWKRSVIEPFVKTLILSSSSPPSHLDSDNTNNANNNSLTQKGEVDQWMNHSSEFLCRCIVSVRLQSIFDDIVDFPDSRPHLVDIADCVSQQPSLLREVARTTKFAITTRLQHAGASTANVLFLLSQTCRALCVIRPGKAAGEALIRQVTDTTIRHLRARADAVSAVVAAITDTKREESNAWARITSSSSSGGTTSGGTTTIGENDDQEDPILLGSVSSRNTTNNKTTTSNNNNNNTFDGPDILKMLLSVLTVPVIVKEYCRTLAAKLLRSKPNSIEVDKEKEVLERLKVLLGEDSCSNAAVILKDFETSRRWYRSMISKSSSSSSNKNNTAENTNNNNVDSAAAAVTTTTTPTSSTDIENENASSSNTGNSSDSFPKNVSTTIVSAACWPESVSDGPVAQLKLHPKIDASISQVSESFHKWKQNQSLRLLPHHGFLEISLLQKQQQQEQEQEQQQQNSSETAAADASSTSQMIRKTFRVNLVAASVVLYLSEKKDNKKSEVESDSSSSASGSGSSSSSLLISELAKTLNITEAELAQHLQDYTPQLFVFRESSSSTSSSTNNNNNNKGETEIELQQQVISNRVISDDAGDDAVDSAELIKNQAESVPALPAGLTQTTIDMLQQMLKSMIANTGAKSAVQIENAARVVGMFSGTSSDMREILSYFLQRNVICTDGSGTYKLPAE